MDLEVLCICHNLDHRNSKDHHTERLYRHEHLLYFHLYPARNYITYRHFTTSDDADYCSQKHNDNSMICEQYYVSFKLIELITENELFRISFLPVVFTDLIFVDS